MNDLKIVAKPHYLRAEPVFIGGVAQGASLSEIVAEVHGRAGVTQSMRQHAVVQLDGEVIDPKLWDEVRPECGANIVVTHGVGKGGGGGKNPLAMVLSLAVVVAAPYMAWSLGAALGAGFAVGEFGFAVSTGFLSVATPLVAGVGLMSVNALFPTRSASLSSAAQTYNDSPTYSLSGTQNDARPFSPVPVVLGRHKVVPAYGAKPFTEISGNDEYLRMLFVWGYGPLKIEDIRIGDTPIGDYEDIEIETREGRPDDAPITLIPSQVVQEGVGVTLTNSIGWIQRTTKANTDEISVDISFPAGLVKFNDNGGRDAMSVAVAVAYRAVGAPSWINQYTFNVTDKFVGNLRKGYRWKVPRGQYEVRLCRVTADSTNDRIKDTVSWMNLRSFRAEHPVSFPAPLAMTAIRIRANEQLQGVIDDLNAVVSSYAPIWDGTAWGGEAATQNPAALMRLVLTGSGNARARMASQIDDVNLGAFYEFCAENGYKFNMVRDYAASVWDVCADICSAARAAPNIVDGKWGVIMDSADKPVVQHFTPRNSWGFKGSVAFVDAPHAFRVKFVDEDNGFEQTERIVYDDGHDESTASKFEGIEFPGITDADLVWKFGRYHIAQARLRPQTYTFNADFEHLVCQRGDLIRVSHDVPLWGGGAARVKELVLDEENGRTTGVVLDECIVMVAGKTYVCRFRSETGETVLCSVLTDVGETDTLAFSAAIPTAQGPQKDDLAMFGEAERETAQLLIKAIRPGEDLTAEIECVDYAPEIYEADQGEIPAFNPNVTGATDPAKITPAVPAIVGVDSGTAALEKSANGIKARILVSLKPGNSNTRVGQYAVRYRLEGSSDWRYVQQSAEQTVVPLGDVIEGDNYVIQARAVSVYGVESEWTEPVQQIVVGQSERPADVTNFRVNVVDGIAYFSWDANLEIDHSHYQIRWSPEKDTVPAWGGTVAIVDRIAATSLPTQALDGTYLIKAVDYSGNESANAAAVIVNITRVAGMNFIEEIRQPNPNWSGTGTATEYDAALGGIVLDGTSDEGVFELDNIIDLQNVFSFRVTASVVASAVNLATNLYDVADIYALQDVYGGATDQTSVGIEIRTTNDDPFGDPVWTEWKPLVVGEYQARSIHPRLRLKGIAPSITPVVTEASIIVDMKDSVRTFNVTVPSGGTRVVFDPPFFVTPEIGLSVENGSEGDRYTITNKDRNGFDIDFTNGGNPVAGRIASGLAKAYGEQV